MFSSNNAFVSGRWNGEIRYFTDFQDSIFHKAEAKGVKYILNMAHDMPVPEFMTDPYMKYSRDCDILLSIVRSVLGTIPLSMVQDLLDRADLSSRKKSVRVLRRLAKDRERNILTAIEEIEADLARLSPVVSFPAAQLLAVDILSAQRLLTNLAQPMAETRMKQILFKNMKHNIFDSVTAQIDEHHDWSFDKARTVLNDTARRWKVRNADVSSDVVEKRNKVDDNIPYTVMAANAIHESPSVNPKCFNCFNQGHVSKDCVAPFCGKCKATWPMGHPQRHSSHNCPIVSDTSRGQGGRTGSAAGRGGRGRGGRTVNAYQSTPAARVNSMMTEVDPFAEENYQSDTFQQDIEAWEATHEFEESDSSFYASISMMKTPSVMQPMHISQQALMVLSDSGANIVGIPQALPALLHLEEFLFDPPFLVEFGNQQTEWSYSYVIFPSLFGGKAAVLKSLKHVIMSNTIANRNGYSISHTYDMKCVISTKGAQGLPDIIIFEAPVNPTSELYLFNIKDVFKVLKDAPILPSFLIAGPTIEKKKSRMTQSIVNEVMLLHQRMGHPSPEIMVRALSNGAWFNSELSAQVIYDAFRYNDCLQCKLAKSRRLPISVGSGAKPPYIGYEVSVDYIAVSILGKGGYNGFYLFKESLTGLLIPYLVKDKTTLFLTVCLSVKAFFKSYGKDVRRLRVDSGTVEADKDTILELNNLQISVHPALPEAQFQNPVERSVQTVANLTAAILCNQENLNNTFWTAALINCCDTWNHSPNSLTGDTTPMFHLNNQNVDLNIRFLFPFGQAVAVHRLKQEKKNKSFKFLTNNEFGYALGSTPVPNRGVLVYLPKRRGNGIFKRKDVTAINLGNELLHQADDTAPASIIFTSDNEIILPENTRLKGPGVRFIDLQNGEDSSTEDSNSLEPSLPSRSIDYDESDGENSPDLVSDDSSDDENENPTDPDSSSPTGASLSPSLSIASRLNHRKRVAPNTYTSDKYILSAVDIPSKIQVESDDDPTLTEAMSSANWLGPLGWSQAIHSEFSKLKAMGTGEEVIFEDIPKDAPLYPSKMVCKKKREPIHGTVTERKARLCTLGNTGRNNPKFQAFASIPSYFAPTGNEKSLKIIFLLAVIMGMFIAGVDVASAFLYSEIRADKPTFISLPPKLTSGKKIYWKLKKTLYGLPESPQAFYDHVSLHLMSNGYTRTQADPCVFYLRHGDNFTVCFVHVDDFAIAATSQELIDSFMLMMKLKYKIKTINELKGFLGMRIDYLKDGSVVLTQPAKIQEILDEYDLDSFTGALPSVPMASTFSDDYQDDANPIEFVKYMRLLGKLLFVIKTRPDIAYAVNRLATRAIAPTERDWHSLQRVALYLKATSHLGIKFKRSESFSATSATQLHCYVDAAFSCHADSKSHTGYCFALGGLGGMFYSKSFKQDNTTLSSTEAENAAAVEAAKEIKWFRDFLNELGFPQAEPTVVFADNSSMITLAQNFSGNHKRVKHYLRRINFLIELIKTSVIHFTHVASENNIADILTKPLGPQQFIHLRDILLGYAT